MTATPANSVTDRLRSVKGPRPVLSKKRTAELTPRQRELLDQLSELFADGFAHLTMADLAAALNCSLRTLYGLAPSRDDLVLLVVDRNLWSVGRAATAAIDPDLGPLEAIRSYLNAANVAVENTTPGFAHDCAANQATLELNRSHSAYLIAVTRELIDMAVETGELEPLDSAAVAHVIAGMGASLAGPEVLVTLSTTPTQAANAMVDVILAGLPRSSG